MSKFTDDLERERRVTVRLAGFSSEDLLTAEQKDALDAYMQAFADFYLSKWGESGPRGAVLREETEAETVARLAWEEAIRPKPPMKIIAVREIIEQPILDLLKEHGAQIEARAGIHVVTLPETAEIEKGGYDNEYYISFTGGNYGPFGEYQPQYLILSTHYNATQASLEIGEWEPYTEPELTELLDEPPF